MNASSFTRRLFVLGLAASTAACHHSPASAQDKDGGAAPTPPAVPAPPPQRQQQPADPLTREAEIEAEEALREATQRQFDLAQRQKDATIRAKDAALRAANAAGKRVEEVRVMSAQPFRSGFTTKGMWMQSIDGPAVITTTPIDSTVQAEWKEDLDVMDKVLRESAGGIEGAMGIISLGRVNPMYVEGAGVVLGMSVAWPLAAGTSADADPNGPTTRERPSRWATARRELRGEPAPKEMGKTRTRQAFDDARLEHFIEAILKTLPEASNFRHLKPDEWVFITVNGTNEDGTPVRMTLKAKKSDIDAASKGTVDAQEFAKRVAQRIG